MKKMKLLLVAAMLALSLGQSNIAYAVEKSEPVITENNTLVDETVTIKNDTEAETPAKTENDTVTERIESEETEEENAEIVQQRNADDVLKTVGAGTGATAEDPLVISTEEAFLWDSRTDKTILAGINPEWYEANVKNAGVDYISIKFPAETETIRKDFGGIYTGYEGYSSTGKQLRPAAITCKQVFVDFSEATKLKKISTQAFFEVSGLSGVIDLSNTSLEVIEGSAFRKTAISGVILPDTVKIIGSDPSSPGSHAPIFSNCPNLAYIRVAGGDMNAVLELPSGLETIKAGGLYLENTKIENTMKTNPFVIKIPTSVKTLQSTALVFSDNTASAKTQYIFARTDFTDTDFDQDCLFEKSWKSSWGLVRFAGKDAYESFVAKYPNSGKFYGYPTYEFTLKFKDTGITQTKLWGQSIQYEKKNNYWQLNAAYTLPDKPNSEPTPTASQVGYWDLNGNEMEKDSKLPETPTATELTAVWKTRIALIEPTVYYTLNGVVGEKMTSLDPPVLKVPYVDKNPGKIGVYVDHPLLKSKDGTKDSYVYFKYRWIDVQGLRLGSRSTTATPEKGSGIYNRNAAAELNNPNEAYNEITIRDSGDDRVSTGGRDYTFYNCEIYGYYVQNGVEKLFYVSNGLGRAYLGVTSSPAYTTDNMFVICAGFKDVWNVTFDKNGGTAPEGTNYDPSQVEKGNTMIAPEGPLKAGYKFNCWKDTDSEHEYTPGDEIAVNKDLNLVARYAPNSYTIRHDANLADATGMDTDQVYVYDTPNAILQAPKLISPTKNFLGWSLRADALSADYRPGDAVDDMLKEAMVASQDGTITLYAVWQDKKEITMTFRSGEGFFSDNSIEQVKYVRPNQQSVLPEPPSRKGYIFDGWMSGNGDYPDLTADDKETPVAIEGKNVVYTAKWKSKTPAITDTKPGNTDIPQDKPQGKPEDNSQGKPEDNSQGDSQNKPQDKLEDNSQGNSQDKANLQGNSQKKQNSTPSSGTAVQTGDQTKISIWVVGLAVAALATIVIFKRLKKNSYSRNL